MAQEQGQSTLLVDYSRETWGGGRATALPQPFKCRSDLPQALNGSVTPLLATTTPSGHVPNGF